MALAVSALRGQVVTGWHAHGGQLWVELPDRGSLLACDCGKEHLLATEVTGGILLVTCHACGRCREVLLASGRGPAAEAAAGAPA